MMDRNKLIDSLCACRKVEGYACDTDCYFFNNAAYVDCIEALLDNLYEYIGDLEDAKAERDQLSDALLKLETAYLTEMVYQDLKEAEEERDRLKAENQNLLKKARIWKRVEDEKPKYNKEVKVWTAEGREYIAFYTYSKEWITEYFFDLTKKVTHWAELDEAPETWEGEENA